MAVDLTRLVLLVSLLAFPLVAQPVLADDAGESAAETEINFLITAIGDSGCDFIRNGKRHSARDAEAHIRTKYRRGRRYAPTAELFIKRLASRSSMSKKPYWIECAGQEPVESGAWLTARLDEYRESVPGE